LPAALCRGQGTMHHLIFPQHTICSSIQCFDGES
jgi:hypothetical protein